MLSSRQVKEYLQNSYAKVDGLWFLKTEEQFGFEKALGIDLEVWKVMPKIQARYFKSVPKIQEIADDFEMFFKCLKIKMKLDNFKIKAVRSKQDIRNKINYIKNDSKKSAAGGPAFKENNMITVTINNCPWHNLMIKSGRENLSEKIGELICRNEYSIFASEFDKNIKFELGQRICKGSPCCRFIFSKKKKELQKLL
ncbi:MAG: L-2-amino-thiazoline-4-carboxylic acid hydrolase [Actinobacteria bacterium]|nr:L-2-amino-thiazoline-4-carboxylic acid hydrolase [Actinomycetota bacterium]